MTLPTDPSPSTMKSPQMPPFSSAPFPPPLLAPPLEPAPAPPGGGYLLQSDGNDKYFEEEEDFNRERDDYAYLYEGERWTVPSSNGEEDIEIDLVRDTMWLIQNPQWESNLHWISAANEEILGNFISHLPDLVLDSVLESLGM